MNGINEGIDNLISQTIEYAPKILLGLVLLMIGWRLISWFSKYLKKILAKSSINTDVQPFLIGMITLLLKTVLVICFAEMIGIKTASFVALLAALGFAIGMALQGSLSNFSAGVMILLFRPYRLGDIIEISGEKGEVIEIQIFNTILKTVTNKTVIIPNSTAVSNKIINYSTIGNTRVDVYFHIPYDENFEKIDTLLLTWINTHDKILQSPPPSIDIEGYESHNIQVGVFVFCEPKLYWQVYYDINNAIKRILGQNGIKVAYSEGIELGMISGL